MGQKSYNDENMRGWKLLKYWIIFNNIPESRSTVRTCYRQPLHRELDGQSLQPERGEKIEDILGGGKGLKNA